jgi:hypothetical protein
MQVSKVATFQFDMNPTNAMLDEKKYKFDRFVMFQWKTAL